VRHAALDEDLVPYPERVAQRYQAWLQAQAAGGRQFSAPERWWLDEIARYIGINLSINADDLNYSGFQARGGQVAAAKQFGAKLPVILEELNTKLGT
jgi:type I restriction enzyme R subunit